ncbi:unnamed protein product [Penicillium nalgiovense]|nr:unnamed protein product [Penicillium nalgiovense]
MILLYPFLIGLTRASSASCTSDVLSPTDAKFFSSTCSMAGSAWAPIIPRE